MPVAEAVKGGNSCDFIILIFDREYRTPTEPYHTFRVILRRQPEIVDFDIPVSDQSIFDPHRRIPGRLPFDSNNREVFRIHPDLSPIKIFVLGLWQQIKY